MIRRPPRSTLFPTRRSSDLPAHATPVRPSVSRMPEIGTSGLRGGAGARDRKSTRLNSSHTVISYAVFCLKKKKKKKKKKNQNKKKLNHKKCKREEMKKIYTY